MVTVLCLLVLVVSPLLPVETQVGQIRNQCMGQGPGHGLTLKVLCQYSICDRQSYLLQDVILQALKKNKVSDCQVSQVER